MNLLYVEDDKLSRKVMRLLVLDTESLTHVEIFEDSANFMERLVLLDPQPQMILLDIHIHPLSGFEMLQLLRDDSRYHDVPVVALTASVMNEEVQKLKTSGFDGVVAKPINPDNFASILNRIYHGENVWTIIN